MRLALVVRGDHRASIVATVAARLPRHGDLVVSWPAEAAAPLERKWCVAGGRLAAADELERSSAPGAFGVEAAARDCRPALPGKSGAPPRDRRARAASIPSRSEASMPWPSPTRFAAVVLADDVDALLAGSCPSTPGAVADWSGAHATRGVRHSSRRRAGGLPGATTRLADPLPHRASALTCGLATCRRWGRGGPIRWSGPATLARAWTARAIQLRQQAPPPPAVPTLHRGPALPRRATAFVAPPGAHTRAVLEAQLARGARVVRGGGRRGAGEDGAVGPEAWLA